MIFRRSSKHTQPAATRTESTVTIEDLLKFKQRAEQPAPEFWTDFDRQLKERQRAAAIHETRPWWHALPRIAIAIPAGATAALAIGFIVWRNAAPAPIFTDNTQTQQTLPSADAALAATTPEPTSTTPDTAAITNVATTQSAPASPTTAAEAAATQPVAPQHIETARAAFATLATLRTSPAENATITFFNGKTQTTKTTSTAALFSMPVAIAGELNASLPATTSSTTTTETLTTPASANDEPLDPRRERLLTYIDNTIPTAAASVDNPRVTRLRDRVTSRFNDKTLSDSISRVATTGDSLSIKF